MRMRKYPVARASLSARESPFALLFCSYPPSRTRWVTECEEGCGRGRDRSSPTGPGRCTSQRTTEYPSDRLWNHATREGALVRAFLEVHVERWGKGRPGYFEEHGVSQCVSGCFRLLRNSHRRIYLLRRVELYVSVHKIRVRHSHKKVRSFFQSHGLA